MNHFPKIGLFLIALVFFACKMENTEEYWSMEDTEINAIELVNNESQKGALTYKETQIFDAQNRPRENWFYNKDKQLTTFERFMYREDEKLSNRSNFYNYNDSLLSYYEFKYDDKGNRIQTLAYDASNDELLRVETFGFDTKGNRIWREIRTAEGQLARRYEFGFDTKGNENRYTVFDENKLPILGETFTVTQSDEDGWIEMWSFRNDKPNTVKTKTKKRFLPKEIKEIR